MHSLRYSGIRKSWSTVIPSASLRKRGFGFEIPSGAKAANVLGNSKERFRCTYVMHLELLGFLWLLRIMRAESSESLANYAVCEGAAQEKTFWV